MDQAKLPPKKTCFKYPHFILIDNQHVILYIHLHFFLHVYPQCYLTQASSSRALSSTDIHQLILYKHSSLYPPQTITNLFSTKQPTTLSNMDNHHLICHRYSIPYPWQTFTQLFYMDFKALGYFWTHLHTFAYFFLYFIFFLTCIQILKKFTLIEVSPYFYLLYHKFTLGITLYNRAYFLISLLIFWHNLLWDTTYPGMKPNVGELHVHVHVRQK